MLGEAIPASDIIPLSIKPYLQEADPWWINSACFSMAYYQKDEKRCKRRDGEKGHFHGAMPKEICRKSRMFRLLRTSSKRDVCEEALALWQFCLTDICSTTYVSSRCAIVEPRVRHEAGHTCWLFLNLSMKTYQTLSSSSLWILWKHTRYLEIMIDDVDLPQSEQYLGIWIGLCTMMLTMNHSSCCKLSRRTDSGYAHAKHLTYCTCVHTHKK